jgi:hypothetical protein
MNSRVSESSWPCSPEKKSASKCNMQLVLECNETCHEMEVSCKIVLRKSVEPYLVMFKVPGIFTKCVNSFC